jgi:hypothetical protein
MCGIVLFGDDLGMILGYLLVVGTYCINVVHVVPVCPSLDFTNKW